MAELSAVQRVDCSGHSDDAQVVGARLGKFRCPKLPTMGNNIRYLKAIAGICFLLMVGANSACSSTGIADRQTAYEVAGIEQARITAREDEHFLVTLAETYTPFVPLDAKEPTQSDDGLILLGRNQCTRLSNGNSVARIISIGDLGHHVEAAFVRAATASFCTEHLAEYNEWAAAQ